MESLDPLSAFIAWAKEEPDQPFISYISSQNKLHNVTLRGTADCIVQVRDTLLGGDQVSQNVGLLYGVEPGCFSAFLGCLAAGKTAVFLSPSWSPSTFSIITHRLNINTILHTNLTPPPHLLSSAGISLLHIPPQPPASSSFPDIDLTKVPKRALINHTSGTTGLPKSCPLPTSFLSLGLPKGQFPENATGAVISPPTFSLNSMIIARAPYFRLRLHFPPENPALTFGNDAPDGAVSVSRNILSALRRNVSLIWLPPSVLLGALATISGNETNIFPELKHLILGGEALAPSHLHSLHTSCPNATILNWFGATEATGCISATSISPFTLSRGVLPSQISLDTIWGIEEVVLLDPEDRTKAVPKIEGSRGVFAVISEGPPRPVFEGASEEVCKETFGMFEGKQILIYGDVAEYAQFEDSEGMGVVVHGRIGRDIKINGVFVNLDFFDTFVGERKLVQGRTFTILAQGLIVLFFESRNGEEKLEDEKLEEYLDKINQALAHERASAKVAAVFEVETWPKVPSGKIDGKALEVLAKQLLEERSTGDVIPESETTALEISNLAIKVLNLGEAFKGKDFRFSRVGIDSITAVSLVSGISQKFHVVLRPESVLGVRDSPRTLADLVLKGGNSDEEDIKSLIEKELETFRPQFEAIKPKPLPQIPNRIFLTGATGFLGTFTLHALLKRYPNSQIIALARAPTPSEARSRVLASLTTAQLSLTSGDEERIQVLQGDLALPHLGLSQSHRDELHKEGQGAELIVHVGAKVHWTLPYSSLRDANVVSTLQLLRTGIPMIFVAGGGDVGGRVNDGYTVSKSVAQALVLESARVQGWEEARVKGWEEARVVKPGFILGDSVNGVANTDDFIWRLVKTVAELGVVDGDSENLSFSAASVDAVAEEVVSSFDRTENVKVVDGTYSFADLWASMEEVGYKLIRVAGVEWLKAFEKDLEKRGSTHPMVAVKHLMLGNEPSLKKFGSDSGGKGGDIKDVLVRNIKFLIEVGFFPDPTSGLTAGNGNGFERTGR